MDRRPEGVTQEGRKDTGQKNTANFKDAMCRIRTLTQTSLAPEAKLFPPAHTAFLCRTESDQQAHKKEVLMLNTRNHDHKITHDTTQFNARLRLQFTISAIRLQEIERSL